jgi:altronate hydrolase
MVGLGCETMQLDFLLECYGIERGPLFRTMNIQHMGGLRRTVDAGIRMVGEMLPHANLIERVRADASHLTLALQCGGSDAWSGVTANPALGYAADLLGRNGGTAVLAETPEIYGAEHLLTARARDEAVARKLMDRIAWWEAYTARNGGSMDNNPSPGNKEGGLTTILEKSLGAVAKSGTCALEGVYLYGEPIDRKGFVFMDSPGYDPASITGEIASGCTIAAFTTGRGSVFGSKPSPCIKIATNTEMATRMADDMDVDAGRIVSAGASVEEVGQEIFDLLLRVASGEPSLSEAQGLGNYEFVPWQVGAVM